MNLRKAIHYLKYIKKNFDAPVRGGGSQRVIDIGSGHAPFIRADILCDAFIGKTTLQRPSPKAFVVKGRFVVADVLDLPFKTKFFDFAHCASVLEHVADPVRASAEISRIANRGLLRVPARLWEIMGGSEQHLWLIAREKDKLMFNRKTKKHHELASQIPQQVRDSDEYVKLFQAFHDLFYIDYYWNDTIKIEVVSPTDESEHYQYLKGNADEPLPTEEEVKRISDHEGAGRIRLMLYEAIRRCLGGKNIEINECLACPKCKGPFSSRTAVSLTCKPCNLRYPVIAGIPFLMQSHGIPIEGLIA